MARTRDRLTALKVEKTKKPGMYADGGGLYLQVTGAAAKSWIFRYKATHGERYMGLGSAADVSIVEAREKAQEARTLLRDGIDPIDYRDAKRAQASLSVARLVTFAQCAESYFAAHEAGWRSPKHRMQWRNTIIDYANPVIGELPVADVDTTLVCKVLEPIWTTKTETANRLRNRIELVLDWAAAKGLRPRGDNPARWRGHLDKMYPRRSKLRTVKHLPAMPYRDVPAFWQRLRERDGAAADALAFTILTAVRTKQTLGANWSEIDLDNKVWTVGGSRMKGGRDHTVPLSPAALAILRRQPRAARVFAITQDSMLDLLADMGHDDVTVHGFRSSFRDWAGDETSYPSEIAEAALAHAVEDATQAAYRRGTALEKRRALMGDWARFLTTPTKPGKVIPIRAAR